MLGSLIGQKVKSEHSAQIRQGKSSGDCFPGVLLAEGAGLAAGVLSKMRLEAQHSKHYFG
jgi:hypothetical protein